jgi:hypothetical protein
VDAGGFAPHMALSTEFPVKLAGEVVKLGHVVEIATVAGGIEYPVTPSPIQAAVLPLPGQLNVFDDPRVGIHEIGADTPQLIGMACTAALFPAVRVGWIPGAEHGAVGGLLVQSLVIPTMTGYTGAMTGRGMLDAPMA